MNSMFPLKHMPLLLALLGAFFTGSIAMAEEAPQSEKPEQMAVLFYADWCGSCKVLDPRIEEVRSELGEDTKTLFVTFDLTDPATRAQTAMLAESLGLGSVYEEYGAKTGFLLVIDANDKKVLQKLTKADEVETIRTHLAAR